MKKKWLISSIITLALIGSFFLGQQFSSEVAARSSTLWRSLLLKTGQTTSYVDYDDGYYEKGIAKSYTVLTAGQFAGTTNITINSKTDVHSNNCVLDNNTGLMWSRYVSASVGPASDGKIPWTTTGAGATAEGIYPYCAAANVALLGGYGDWRVANRFELESLFNIELISANPDIIAFPSGWTASFWTSSTVKEDTTYAWSMSVGWGGDTQSRIKTNNYCIALVRGG